MPTPEDWYPHRRPSDDEHVGWIVPEGERYRAVDLLGRTVSTEPLEWLDAEALLDELGIGYLADRWALTLPDGSTRPVRIAEAGPSGIVVVTDEFGAASVVGGAAERFTLGFPAPTELVAGWR